MSNKKSLILALVLSAVVAALVAYGFNVAVAPQETPESRAIRERISIDARDDAYFYGGAKTYWFSDDHATNKVLVDGSVGAVQINATAAMTSTPGVLIKAGIGNALEIQNVLSTPVAYIDKDGALTYSGFSSGGGAVDGDTAITGSLTTSEGITVTTGGVNITAGGITADGFNVADVTGDTVVSGTLTVSSTSTLVGAVAANGGLTVDGVAFSVANATGNTVVSGTLTVSGTSTLAGAVDLSAQTLSNIGNAGTDFSSAGGLTLADKATVGTYLTLSAQAFTFGAGEPITPTKTYVVITTTASIATSTTVPIVAAGHAAGEILILRNGNASDTITIDGTGGTVECKADIVMGASDTATFINNGSKWNCLAVYDNS